MPWPEDQDSVQESLDTALTLLQAYKTFPPVDLPMVMRALLTYSQEPLRSSAPTSVAADAIRLSSSSFEDANLDSIVSELTGTLRLGKDSDEFRSSKGVTPPSQPCRGTCHSRASAARISSMPFCGVRCD